MYSVLALAVAAKTADVILTMGDAAKSVFVLSEKTQEVNDLSIRLNECITEINDCDAEILTSLTVKKALQKFSFSLLSPFEFQPNKA